jgi:[ribosomal protein S5]-alanine N-acetyltransferase
MKVILETDRLLLREYVEEDAEAFFKLNSDPEVLRFVPDKRLLNVEQARQILIDHPIADYRKYGFGRGACILKSTGEQIGFAGLKYLEELGEVDVAFRLMRNHWAWDWRLKRRLPPCVSGSLISTSNGSSAW